MKGAVLGLGRMGQAIAGRLLEGGHELTVWNRSSGKAGTLVDRGAAEAGSVADAVAGAEFVVVSLSGDDAVREVLLQRRPDTGDAVVVDCSTVSPSLSREEADAYPGRFVACPIAGAPAAVENGAALLIVGGAPAAVEAADPVLTAVSEKRRPAGADAGTAAVIKLLNNYLLLGGLAVLADAVAAAQAIGFDDADLADLFGNLPVVAPGLTNRIEGLAGTDHEAWFSVDLGHKDLTLFSALTEESGVRLGLAETVRGRYGEAQELGLGDRDLTAVIETLRRSGATG